MTYRVILKSGELADGSWDRPEEIPDEVRAGKRLISTERLRILVEDGGEEYEVGKWDL